MSDVVKSPQFTAPPGPIAQAASQFALEAAAAALKPGERGGVFGVLSRRADGTVTANAAIVVRSSDERLAVTAWIAKDWSGTPVGGFAYGAGGKLTW